MEKLANGNGEKFGGERVFFSLVKLAVPSVVGMMVISLYSICDTFFLSLSGETAVGGVCYPVVAVMQGVVMTFAFGGANKISACFGKGDLVGVKGYFSSGLFSAVFASLFFGGCVFAFALPIAKFCGGGESAGAYLAVCGISMAFLGVYFYYSACLRGVGRANVVLIASLIGLLGNFALDFFAVKVLHLGVLGVAVATGIAQVVSGGFMVVYSVLKVDVFAVGWKYFDIAFVWEIISLGGSSFFRQLMCGLSAITLNIVCGRIGGETLAGCTVASKISVFAFAFGLGIAQGMQPVVAYHFGGGDVEKAKRGITVGVLLAVAVGVVVGVFQFVFADDISGWFAFENTQSGMISAAILKVSAFSTAFSFLLVAVNMAFQAVGMKFLNIAISLLRQGVVFIPVLLILSKNFGANGIVWAHFTSDMIAGVVVSVLLIWLLCGKSLNKKVVKIANDKVANEKVEKPKK